MSDVCVHPGISDHNIVAFSISGNPRTCRIPPRKIYQFHKADLQKLRKAVAKFSMDFLSSSPELKSVDENWTCITSLINKCKDEFIPSKMSRARRNLPWITISLKRQMRKRDRLFKRARSQPSASNWKAYRQLRNELTKRVRQAHHNYVCNIIGESLYANPKAFWSYVKQRRSENFGIPPLRNDNKLHITNKDKAECLNNYFHSTFTKSNVDQVCINRPSLYNDIGHLHIHRSGVVNNNNYSAYIAPNTYFVRSL